MALLSTRAVRRLVRASSSPFSPVRAENARSSSGVAMRSGERSEFVGRSDGVSATPTAYREAELGEPRIESALQGPHHGRGDAGGVPVHAHHAAQSLEPERIA